MPGGNVTEVDIMLKAAELAQNLRRRVREKQPYEEALEAIMNSQAVTSLGLSYDGEIRLRAGIESLYRDIVLDEAHSTPVSKDRKPLSGGRIKGRAKDGEREKYDRHELQLPRGDRD